jgi:hypothetical protein
MLPGTKASYLKDQNQKQNKTPHHVMNMQYCVNKVFSFPTYETQGGEEHFPKQ